MDLCGDEKQRRCAKVGGSPVQGGGSKGLFLLHHSCGSSVTYLTAYDDLKGVVLYQALHCWQNSLCVLDSD